MPVRNPIITECDTNRVYRPTLTSPPATSTTPTMRASSSSAPGRWSAGTPCSAEPAASAAAEVVVITISRVLEERPPVIGPAKAAYRPCTGLTPTRTAAAIPSGTLLIAPGSPAIRSARRYRRSGLTERSQRPVAAAGPRITRSMGPRSVMYPVLLLKRALPAARCTHMIHAGGRRDLTQRGGFCPGASVGSFLYNPLLSRVGASSVIRQPAAVRELDRFRRPRRRLRAGLVQLVFMLAGLGLGLGLPQITTGPSVASTRVTETLVTIGFGTLGL